MISSFAINIKCLKTCVYHDDDFMVCLNTNFLLNTSVGDWSGNLLYTFIVKIVAVAVENVEIVV